MAQMAITLLTRAIEYDINGRKLESLKLYEDGIEALLKESKGKFILVRIFYGIPYSLKTKFLSKLRRIQSESSTSRIKSSST